MMIDRADGKIAFEFFESLFYFGQLYIVLPELGGVLLYEIGAK